MWFHFVLQQLWVLINTTFCVLTPHATGGAGLHRVPSGNLHCYGRRSSDPLDEKRQHWKAADSPTGSPPGHAAKQLPADLPDAPQSIPQPLSQPWTRTPPPPLSRVTPGPGLQPPLPAASLFGHQWASAGRSWRLRGYLLWKSQPVSLWPTVHLRWAFELTRQAQHSHRDHRRHQRAADCVHQQSAATATVRQKRSFKCL